MSFTPTVLVYDDALETSEVLAAVYQPRGFQVHRRISMTAPDGGATGKRTVVELHSPECESETSPVKVLIGRVDDPSPFPESGRVSACRLSSLFDYRDLVGAIDRLLNGSD